MASRSPQDIPTADWLTDSEREVLLREKTAKWSYPWMLYFLTVMCSMAAATQGMDETANNGALPIYQPVSHSDRLTPPR